MDHNCVSFEERVDFMRREVELVGQVIGVGDQSPMGDFSWVLKFT
jgi:hypothetical protein